MDSHALSPFGSDLKAYILEVTRTWPVQHKFSDVVHFVSGTLIIFTQGNGTKIQSKQFSEFGYQTRKGHGKLILLPRLARFTTIWNLLGIKTGNYISHILVIQ